MSITQSPDLDGLAIIIESINCLGLSVFVEFEGATSLADGLYNLGYILSGANSTTQTVPINFSSGSAIIEIAEALIPNSGTTIFTVISFSESTESCFVSTDNIPSESFEIEAVLAPELSEMEVELCRENSPVVEDLNEFVQNGALVLWYDSQDSGEPLDPSDQLSSSITYYASSISNNSCESIERTAIFVQIIQCDRTVVVPDGFSPNPDGINDDLEIKNLRLFYPDFKLYIYNRYGTMVHKRKLIQKTGTAPPIKGVLLDLEYYQLVFIFLYLN